MCFSDHNACRRYTCTALLLSSPAGAPCRKLAELQRATWQTSREPFRRGADSEGPSTCARDAGVTPERWHRTWTARKVPPHLRPNLPIPVLGSKRCECERCGGGWNVASGRWAVSAPIRACAVARLAGREGHTVRNTDRVSNPPYTLTSIQWHHEPV